LIVLGIAAFAYQGFSYNKQEQIAQIGDVKITAIKHETVYLPPILGGLALVAGVTLLIFGRRTEK
jgi:hypothetical protein